MKVKMEAAVEAHRRWFVRLRVAIETGVEGSLLPPPPVVAADDRCEFGRWLYEDFPRPLRSSPIYDEIRELHAEFHTRAARIVDLAQQRNCEQAVREMTAGSEFNRLSLTLVGRMQQLKEQLELWTALSPHPV
jgi:hypothetical protein